MEIILNLIIFIFGSIFGVSLKYFFEIYKMNNERLLIFKIEKYYEIIENMYYLIENKSILSHGSNSIFSQQDYLDKLYKQYFESFTYAPKNIISAFKKFLDKPNHDNFINYISKIRKDLFKSNNINNIEISEDAYLKIFKS